jgi:hypothetical protein
MPFASSGSDNRLRREERQDTIRRGRWKRLGKNSKRLKKDKSSKKAQRKERQGQQFGKRVLRFEY